MTDPYASLAAALDALPNGFPATPDHVELRLLAAIFSPAEAALAAGLSRELQTPLQVAGQCDPPADPKAIAQALKAMARKGLIEAGRTPDGIGFKLMPFVVGVYEMQIGRIDAGLARLFEDYYTQAFGQILRLQPALHRVVPIEESVRVDLEIHPFESASAIVEGAQSWGVVDCICRTQKALIGEGCEHPLDVCMTLGPYPDMFAHHPTVRPLTRQQAHATLRRAASAGLVHSVGNSQEGLWYICNCCTCSCGILRGMAELGIANAVARSAFVNHVDEARCTLCEACQSYCQFDALQPALSAMRVNETRCIGCGVCIPACPEEALGLTRRPESEVAPVPLDYRAWETQRAAERKTI